MKKITISISDDLWKRNCVCLAHSFPSISELGLIEQFSSMHASHMLKLILQDLIEAKEKQMRQETLN